jgi:hypothetical protein
MILETSLFAKQFIDDKYKDIKIWECLISK